MSLLVFTRTTGFRHESIGAGVAAVQELAGELGVDVVATEDPEVFVGPLGFDAVVFLNTSGDVLTAPGRVAFESYVAGGGAFLGVHCAAATEEGWPFYRALVGAAFAGHPDIQPGRLLVVDRAHPATVDLPQEWDRIDEWYNFAAPVTDRVLLALDEESVSGATMGAEHPLAWCHERLGGRALYTALGHSVEAYAEPLLRRHLGGALRWALGR